MKLNIRKTIPLAVHLLFCFMILFIPLWVMSRNEVINYGHYASYLVRTGLLIAIFYINYFFLIDQLLFKKKITLYIIVNLLLILGISLLQFKIVELCATLGPSPGMGKRLKPGGPMGPPVEMRILGDCIFIVFVVGMSVALKVTMRWYRDSMTFETIKASQLEADLKNLRNQLNPHFLFNTLNNIYSLIAIDTEKAQDSVHRLSALLRYVLYENDLKFVPLGKELEFTQNYIDLMRLRLGPDVKLNVEISNTNSQNQIASLMFMTLIENAFKHGITNGQKSFINIKIEVEDGKGVTCLVENSMDEQRNNIESKNKGIGLGNLERRLKLLYPDKYQLVIDKNNNIFSVLLKVDF
ncbi:MAG: histidine kinase [Dysgonomonas sp.]|nr:histidine kinase [Dysgonomonas sp.]